MNYQQPKTFKDWSILLAGWLAILFMGVNNIFGIDLTPYTGDIVNFILLTVVIVMALYAVWKNTYVSSKAKKQAKVLKDHNLK